SLPRVRADGLDTDAENVTFPREKRHCLRMKAGRVGAIGADVEEGLRALAVRPVRADQYPGMRRNAAMARLPLEQSLAGHQKVGIPCGLLRDVDHTGRPDEAVDRDVVCGIVGVVLAGDPVDRRIEMRTGMLAAGDVVPVPGGPTRVVARDLLQREGLRGGELG